MTKKNLVIEPIEPTSEPLKSPVTIEGIKHSDLLRKRNNVAHSRAVAKYNKENYKTFSVNMRQDEYDKLCLISGSCGIGKSRLLIDMVNRLNDDDIANLISEYKKD